MKNLIRLINLYFFRNSPVYVHYGITHRCNLRCRMCKVDKNINNEEELSLRQIEQVFDILKRAGIVYVSIGGGEPLLREDLVSVIELLIKKGLMVRLLTNGTLAKEALIKSFVSAGLREVSISLDSMSPQIQNYIYGDKEISRKIVNSIDMFSELVPKKGRLLLINTVVSPFNIGELVSLSEFAKDKGYYISFIPVEADSGSEFLFSQKDYRLIDQSYERLIRMKKSGKSNIFNSSIFLERSREYLKSIKRNWQCDAGKLYFSLNPKGEFSVCHKYSPEASLLEKNLKELLTSEAFKNRRKRLVEECAGCMRPCWAEVSFLFKHKRCFWEMVRLESFIKAGLFL